MIEPPEFETRVAILVTKANQLGYRLTDEVLEFIAKIIHSNVRELEGALRRVIATAEFTGDVPDIETARLALADLVKANERLINIENIQKTVCEFYNLSGRELVSSRRSRSIVRPRQMAMALAKDLTSRSLPEIGRLFGGRDHTTVIHACRKMKELIKKDYQLQQDYEKLRRLLSV